MARVSGQGGEMSEGIPGPRGPKGAKGDRGPQGIQGPMGERGVPAEIRIAPFILKADDIAQKKVVINDTIFTNWILLIPDAGVSQRLGIDFEFDKTSNEIRWANLGLDGVLEVNDRIEIHYLHKFE